MKLFGKEKATDWRKTLEESVQLDYADIPNGEVYNETDKDGVEKRRMRTDRKLALGFQTEQGRGKGIQWVPVQDVNPVLERLSYYAKNGVEREELVTEWLSPAESIDRTIARVPRTDSDGNVIDGEYDIAFRTRLGKGSKACHIPEEDFGEFVSMLMSASESLPDAIQSIEAAAAEIEAKKAKKAADSTPAGSDED